MKKLFLISVVIAFAISFSACYVGDPYVQSCCSTRYTSYQVGELIEFDNCSTHATSFFWDFGNGVTSRLRTPTITYSNSGTYEVALTAYSDIGKEVSYLTIKILANTTLDILVMYNGTSDPVSNCQVTLYKNNQDWIDLKNAFDWTTTNTSGRAIFNDMSSMRYYIDAYRKVSTKTYYGNDKLGYITNVLTSNAVNYFDVYVELLNNTKGSNKTYKIIEIKLGDPNNPLRK